MVHGIGVYRGRRHLVRIVVVPGVIPQIRGYRSEGRGEAEPESLLGDEAADAARAEIAEHGTIPWGEVKAGLRIRGAGGSMGTSEPRSRKSLVGLVALWTGLSWASHNGGESPGSHPGDSPSKRVA